MKLNKHKLSFNKKVTMPKPIRNGKKNVQLPQTLCVTMDDSRQFILSQLTETDDWVGDDSKNDMIVIPRWWFTSYQDIIQVHPYFNTTELVSKYLDSMDANLVNITNRIYFADKDDLGICIGSFPNQLGTEVYYLLENKPDECSSCGFVHTTNHKMYLYNSIQDMVLNGLEGRVINNLEIYMKSRCVEGLKMDNGKVLKYW